MASLRVKVTADRTALTNDPRSLKAKTGTRVRITPTATVSMRKSITTVTGESPSRAYTAADYNNPPGKIRKRGRQRSEAVRCGRQSVGHPFGVLFPQPSACPARLFCAVNFSKVMGLNEYVAYRVAARGREGDPALGLFFGILMMGMAACAAVGFVFTTVGTFIYTTVRPVLLIAPKLSVVLGGVLLGSVLFALPAYTDETAARMVRGEDGDDTTGFYVRHLSVLVLMTVTVFLVLVFEADVNLPKTFLAQYTDHAAVGIVGLLFYMVAFPYTLYQLFHLPYRYHRLLRRAPYGTLYSLVTVFPLTATLVATFFNIHVTIVDAPVWSPIAIVFIGCLVAVPYGVPLILVKFQAEPYIPRLDTTPTSASSATSGD